MDSRIEKAKDDFITLYEEKQELILKVASLETKLKEAKENLRIASRIGIRLIRRVENKMEFDAEILKGQMKFLSDMYDSVSKVLSIPEPPKGVFESMGLPKPNFPSTEPQPKGE